MKLAWPAFLIIFSLLNLPVLSAGQAQSEGAIKAPDFNATSVDGKNFSLSGFSGSPLILHITNIEIPLCIECEKSLQGQVAELARLKKMHPQVQIATINLRKNPYSQDGKTLAEK